jgi:hypothetical protein
MSGVFKRSGYDVIETDIIYGQDFFETNVKCDAIITNPPFNLSEQIIVKALKEARLVAMLLKSQYWHSKKRLQLFNDYPPTYVLPLTWRPDFLEHERKKGDKKGSPTMEVCWTVWQKPLQSKTVYQPISKRKY